MPEPGANLECVLKAGAARLRRAGVPGPMPEAVRIWSGLQGTTPTAAFLNRSVPVGDDPATLFRAAIARRASGEPLPYVTGWTGFRHLLLRCDRRALIPRPETEGLVGLVLRVAPAGVVADIGTGTGCIALSLATEGRYARVIGVDHSAGALGLARENRTLTGATVDLMAGDLSTPLAGSSLDLLVSNPPYIAEAEYRDLDPSVRNWEPAAALRSGADGLEATRRLLFEGKRTVRPGGWLALEVDSRRAEQAAGMAGAIGWTEVSLREDVFGRVRYLLAKRSETA